MDTTDQLAESSSGPIACGPSMSGGVEWLVDAYDCDAARLRDPRALAAIAERVLSALALNVVGAPLVHQFGGHGGVTGLYLLSESHFAWHTYPESALATFNLYCCRERAAVDWTHWLETSIGARRVAVTRVVRGVLRTVEQERIANSAPRRSEVVSR